MLGGLRVFGIFRVFRIFSVLGVFRLRPRRKVRTAGVAIRTQRLPVGAIGSLQRDCSALIFLKFGGGGKQMLKQHGQIAASQAREEGGQEEGRYGGAVSW